MRKLFYQEGAFFLVNFMILPSKGRQEFQAHRTRTCIKDFAQSGWDNALEFNVISLSRLNLLMHARLGYNLVTSLMENVAFRFRASMYQRGKRNARNKYWIIGKLQALPHIMSIWYLSDILTRVNGTTIANLPIN